ncbi:MAG: hypothetical protein J7L07_11090 [Candidatus Odinarchaeota archaeon]|nr:hypothetical protein [Candidatus Odinarchaeota archaeon]
MYVEESTLKFILTELISTLISEMERLGISPFAGPLIARFEERFNELFKMTQTSTISEVDELKKRIDELRKTVQLYEAKLAEKEKQIQYLSKQLEQIKASAGASTDIAQRVENLRNSLLECRKKLEYYIKRVQMQEEELNRLYNLTEDDPTYQPYYVLRDEAPNWVSIRNISDLTGIPISKVKKILENFERRGLIEIKNDQARCLMVIRPTR